MGDKKIGVLKVKVFDGGFIQQIMSKLVYYISIISYLHTNGKNREEAKKIMIKYGDMD